MTPSNSPLSLRSVFVLQSKSTWPWRIWTELVRSSSVCTKTLTYSNHACHLLTMAGARPLSRDKMTIRRAPRKWQLRVKREASETLLWSRWFLNSSPRRWESNWGPSGGGLRHSAETCPITIRETTMLEALRRLKENNWDDKTVWSKTEDGTQSIKSKPPYISVNALNSEFDWSKLSNGKYQRYTLIN